MPHMHVPRTDAEGGRWRRAKPPSPPRALERAVQIDVIKQMDIIYLQSTTFICSFSRTSKQPVSLSSLSPVLTSAIIAATVTSRSAVTAYWQATAGTLDTNRLEAADICPHGMHAAYLGTPMGPNGDSYNNIVAWLASSYACRSWSSTAYPSDAHMCRRVPRPPVKRRRR